MLSGNSLRQTVHTHRPSVYQAVKLVAALLRVARVTAGLAESIGSLPPRLWLMSPAGWREDCQARKLNKEDAMDRCKWRNVIKEARWSGWVWVGECFFWYRPTRVVPDQRPLKTEIKDIFLPMLFLRDCSSRRRKSDSLFVNLCLHKTRSQCHWDKIHANKS